MKLRGAIVVLALLLLFYVSLCSINNLLLFYPTKNHIWKPEINYQDFYISNLHAWYFNNYPEAKTILFCHGNAGNISHREYMISLCESQKINLLLFDYSGYGKSKGTPSQKKIISDSHLVYKWLSEKVSSDNIIVWGESLGGAAATSIAHNFPCSALILMSTFSSIDDAIVDMTNKKFLTWVLNGLVDTLQSKVLIPTIKCPIAILHSREDEIIPFKNAERMYSLISHDNKVFIEIEGGHSDPEIDVVSINQLFEFLELSPCTHDVISYSITKIKEIKKNFIYR